jgi:hypothetical protein
MADGRPLLAELVSFKPPTLLSRVRIRLFYKRVCEMSVESAARRRNEKATAPPEGNARRSAD